MVVLEHLVDELLGDVGDRAEVQRHHSCHLVLENFHEVDAGVGADYHLVSQASGLNLVDMANSLESFPYIDLEGADRDDIDEAVVFATDDLVFIYLCKCAHSGLGSDIFNALEVLLHVEDLHLVLPGADEDQFMSQVDAFGEVRSHVESQVERIAVKHINYCIRILHQDGCIAR